MPQPKKGARLGSGPSHQRLMLSNLASSLFQHERIKTTEAKAKLLRPYAERLITKAKKGDVHNRRQVLSVLEDRDVVHKLFSDIAPRFSARNGGYTRIMKLGPRQGDNAPMALIELIEGPAASSEAPTEEAGGRRRRIGRGRRRRGEASDLPQDKPARSRAAEAGAAGSAGTEIKELQREADEEQASQEAAAEAATEDAETADAEGQTQTGDEFQSGSSKKD